MGFIEQEIAYYRYALAAYKSAGNSLAVSHIYYQKANNLYKARYGCCYYSKCENYNNLGKAYSKLGKIHKAIAYHRKAFLKYHSASFRGLAEIYAQGKHNKALINYQTTAHIARRNMNLVEEISALRNMGNLYQQMGNFEQAIAN